ncbi:MAG: hypothetical protein ABJA81_06455, partial [Nocardioidaceae bacterium]
KVCNFSRRRYVKSFPTVGYWLSLVPVIPALREVVTKVCCAALQDSFGPYKTADPDEADDRVSAQAILQLLNIAQAEDPIAQLRNSKQTLRTASKLATDGLWGEATDKAREAFQMPSSGTAKAAPTDELADLRKRLDSVEKELSSLKTTKRRTTAKRET